MYYREKIRALASLIPNQEAGEVLDVGGGRSTLCSLLFPNAQVTNLERDPEVARIWPWMQTSVRLVPGSATDIPFPSETFDCVTALDVLEHIPDDGKAAAELARVLKPGGYLIVSTPTEHFRHPYYKWPFGLFCYTEQEVWEQWGHVRRGYTEEEVIRLFPRCEAVGTAPYLNPLTVIAHDIGFSKLPVKARVALILLQYPVTLIGYGIGSPGPRLSRAIALQRKA
jgi:ubiquinone/menaquinone biosynthesis C-methylase UbiE